MAHGTRHIARDRNQMRVFSILLPKPLKAIEIFWVTHIIICVRSETPFRSDLNGWEWGWETSIFIVRLLSSLIFLRHQLNCFLWPFDCHCANDSNLPENTRFIDSPPFGEREPEWKSNLGSMHMYRVRMECMCVSH